MEIVSQEKALRIAVQQLACAACGHRGRTNAVQSQTDQASEAALMALCDQCKASIENPKRLSPEERREFENELNLKTLRRLVADGYLQVAIHTV